MITEYEQHYCKSCCRLFNDIIRNPYYTRNHFIDNQACLIYNVDYRHEMEQPNYHVQCPYCYSVHNENVKEIMNMRIHGGDRRSGAFLIYNAVKKALEAKHLNTINDK